MPTDDEPVLLRDHSIPLTIILHLAPGALIVAAYWWIGLPISEAVGFPSLFGFLIAGLIVLLPWELGLLLYLGRQRNKRWSLDGVVLFRNRLPKRRLVAVVAGLGVWALAVAIGLSFIDNFLFESLFSWVPDRFQLNGFTPTDHSVALFNVATVLNLLLFGIAMPLVEELYFRGFLLPRMSKLGRSAPIVNSVLFVLYHLWTPWMAVTRILFVTPMVWVVWRKQAIQVSIWTHCVLNCLGILLTYALLMSGV
jgi:membrane protease YdiL (CAAX protease family)